MRDHCRLDWLRRRAKVQEALAIVLDRLALLDTPAAIHVRKPT